jgi:hypothetical protein
MTSPSKMQRSTCEQLVCQVATCASLMRFIAASPPAAHIRVLQCVHWHCALAAVPVTPCQACSTPPASQRKAAAAGMLHRCVALLLPCCALSTCCTPHRTGQIDAVEFKDRFFGIYGQEQAAQQLFVEMCLLVPNPARRMALLAAAPDVRGSSCAHLPPLFMPLRMRRSRSTCAACGTARSLLSGMASQ